MVPSSKYRGMVYPGPWIQEPDYTKDETVTDRTRLSYLSSEGIDAFPRAFADHSFISANGPSYFEDGSFIEMFAALQDIEPKIGYGNNPRVTDLGRRSMQILPGDAWDNYGYIGMGHCPFPICYWTETWKPEMPEDAIGLEYQGHPEWTNDPVNNPFQVALEVPRVGATLLGTTTMRKIGSAVQYPEPYRHRLALADWGRAFEGSYHETALTPQSGNASTIYSTTHTTVASVTDFSLGADFDLTGKLDMAQGGVLYTSNETFVPTTIAGYGADWSFGTSIATVQLRETFRPPVYRFLYDGVPVISGKPDIVRRRFVRA